MKRLNVPAHALGIVVLCACLSSCGTSKKGRAAVYELKQDIYLYRYCREYQLASPVGTPFTMEEFRRNPDIGVIDKEANIGYVAIVPKGTKIMLTGSKKTFHWTNGCWESSPCGKILSEDFSRYGTVVITYGLKIVHTSSGAYLDVYDEAPDQTSIDAEIDLTKGVAPLEDTSDASAPTADGPRP